MRPRPDVAVVEAFDPESPYAFAPPEYDSLPKDPPKYLDVFGDGCDNHAFQDDMQKTQPKNSQNHSTPVNSTATLDVTDESGDLSNGLSVLRCEGISNDSDDISTGSHVLHCEIDSGFNSRANSISTVHEGSSQQDTVECCSISNASITSTAEQCTVDNTEEESCHMCDSSSASFQNESQNSTTVESDSATNNVSSAVLDSIHSNEYSQHSSNIASSLRMSSSSLCEVHM